MSRLIKFFAYDHLPEHLQEVPSAFCHLAQRMDQLLEESAEKTAGLRKLLEAKDCFVRARIEQDVALVGDEWTR